MKQPLTPASDLERRKQVKLRLRTDLAIAPHKYEGRTFFVVKDPVSLRYYRFKDQEHFLIQLMDGRHTLDDAQKEFEQRYRPDRLTLEDLEQFGQQLLKAGLVQNESPQSGKQLFEQRTKRVRSQVMQTITNVLYIKIPLFDPDKLLAKMVPYCRFMFTMWFLLASLAFMLSAVALVGTHFETFYSRMPSFHEFFSFQTVGYLWIALGVVKVIHEFGHGLSCKTFGGEVHEMGLLFLCLSPAMYCNVSDAWTLPSKWQRIVIGSAGIYVELMIAAAATFFWWNTPGWPFWNYMALCLMIVCSVNTVFFNGNPLMRFDGYYILADLLEIPNLREKANRYLQRLGMEYGLGMEVQPEPYMATGRKALFFVYAVGSYIYRWVVTFTVIYFLSHILKPYKLEVLSQLLAVFALGSLLGWPAWRLIQNYQKRGRLPDMKMLNVSISASLIAVVVLLFFFLPLPVSRIREAGVVQVKPAVATPVPVKVPAVLDKIYVREGEFVRKGAVLATFSDLELESAVDAAQADVTVQEKIVNEYKRKLPEGRLDRSVMRDIFQGYLAATKKLEQARDTLGFKRKTVLEQLTLVAPRDGIAMGVPLQDEIGKRWEIKEKGSKFCTIGDPRHLRVLLPIGPDDYDLLQENLKKANRTGTSLPVVIRIQGRDIRMWSGHVALSYLPQEVAKEIPLALSSKGGGPLAVKPGAKEEHLLPQSQVYLVPVDIDDPDHAISPGAMAQVKIYLEYRSGAWWAWRKISQTFDLPLI
jgi:putative peptide zinc metalloprotease protein